MASRWCLALILSHIAADLMERASHRSVGRVGLVFGAVGSVGKVGLVCTADQLGGRISS